MSSPIQLFVHPPFMNAKHDSSIPGKIIPHPVMKMAIMSDQNINPPALRNNRKIMTKMTAKMKYPSPSWVNIFSSIASKLIINIILNASHADMICNYENS